MDTGQHKKRLAVLAEITDIRILENGWYSLALNAPEIAGRSLPGQFVQVQVSAGMDPLLRRPFSIAGVSAQGDIQLLIRVVGRGTRILSRKRLGDTLDIIGPLGRGFPEIAGRTWTVAGGTGLAPFLFMTKRAGAQHELTLFYGACTATDCQFLELAPFKFIMEQAPPVLTTESGELGEKGLVTQALESRLAQAGAQATPAAIFSCGPIPMMKRVHEIAQAHSIPCHVSLEAFMGCGFGACMGCVAPAASKPYVHVCEDGPVFESREIAWEKIGAAH